MTAFLYFIIINSLLYDTLLQVLPVSSALCVVSVTDLVTWTGAWQGYVLAHWTQSTLHTVKLISHVAPCRTDSVSTVFIMTQ